MPLPQQVIEQLGREPVKTPGWSSGILLFSSSILGLIILIYVGLVLGYQPYLQGQIKNTQGQINQLAQSISATDQANLITYYSEISNLRSLIANHVFFSYFLTWLGSHTEANVYYRNLTFTSGNQVTLTAFANSQSDINQQLAVFESSSQVQGVVVSNISFSAVAGLWTFGVTLTMQPSVFSWPSSPASSSTATTAITTSTTP